MSDSEYASDAGDNDEEDDSALCKYEAEEYADLDRKFFEKVFEARNPAKAKALVKLLIKRGADFNLKDNYEGQNFLHRLCYEPLRPELIKLVLTGNINVNAVDESGRTALHCLCPSGRHDDGFYHKPETAIPVLRQLVKAGANIEVKDSRGSTALISLCEQSSEVCTAAALPVVRELIELGADVHATDKRGCTALHYAALAPKSAEVSRLLLDKGADPNARDNNGFTPLFFASEGDSAAFLTSRGADTEVLSTTGLKPIAQVFWIENRGGAVAALVQTTKDAIGSILSAAPLTAEACRSRRETRSYADGFVSPERLMHQHFVFIMERPVAELLLDPRKPLRPAYRAFARWAVTSEAGAKVVANVMKSRSGEGGAITRDEKLKPLKDDGWERRKHLVCCYVKTREARRGGTAKTTKE